MILRFLWLLPALMVIQCTDAPRSHNWFAMDTNMSITLYGAKGHLSDDAVFAKVDAETARLGALFTDYSTQSGLAHVRGTMGDTLSVDPEIYGVLRTALEMGRESRGAFDITLHDLKTLWGLDGNHQGHIPRRADLDSLMHDNTAYGLPSDSVPRPPLDFLSDRRIVIRRGDVTLDLGGITKGYIVDRIHVLLDSLGVPNHIVQAGGDIRLGGNKKSGAWSVGIRHPRYSDSLAGTITADHAFSVSTAGDYERFFFQDGVRYHHIFNPRTGYPVQGVSSVTVIAKTSEAADAIDDALFVLGPKNGLYLAKKYGVEVVWFLETSAGLCAVTTPGMSRQLTLSGVRNCPPE